MRHRSLHSIMLLSVLILIAGVLGVRAQDTVKSPLDNLVERSLQQVNANGPVRVVAAYDLVQPDLEHTGYMVKILDVESDHVHTFWYDQQLQPIAERELFEQRAAAYEARYGRLSRSLFRQVEAAQPDTIIPVSIWAEESWPPVATDGYLYFLPFLSGGSGTSTSCSTPLTCVVAFLRDRGVEPDYVSSEMPIVFADVPASLIVQLQAIPSVAAIYEQQEFSLALASAARTSAAPWTWERGITGRGIKVAVLEPDGVDFDNPFISGSHYYAGWLKRIGQHATGVAGVIASTDATHRGIAHGAEILSANALGFGDAFIVAAADWAVESGADVINASFGTICQDNGIASLDKYMDWLVWQERVTVTVAAGNLRERCSSNYNVASPGKAYNVITVGSKDDRDTAGNEADTRDDQFSSFSLYRDPATATSNRLKPEVVAVGERIITTYSVGEPWFNSLPVQGTSFAAPIVAGQAALMMERASWLQEAPEAVKAGVMATARWTELHDDQNWSQWASVDKMGVGAVDTTAADNSLINNRIHALYLHENDFSSNAYDVHLTASPGSAFA